LEGITAGRDVSVTGTWLVQHGVGRRAIWMIAVTLAVIAGATGWNSYRAPAVIKKAVTEAAQAAADPDRIKASLERSVREGAAAEIAMLDPVKDWKNVAEIEKARDQQLAEIPRMLEQIVHTFKKKEASENYVLANKILAAKGVQEALAFLESKSAERESKIAALKGEQPARQGELRNLLREKLLTGSLLEKSLQFDKALEQYRAVIADDPTWAESRYDLADLLRKRGQVIDPAKGNALLREAAALCRESVALPPEGLTPEERVGAQYMLGVVLEIQADRTSGAESSRLVEGALAAFREALKILSREHSAVWSARVQTGLGNALMTQAQIAPNDEKGRQSLAEAAAAYREALKLLPREQFPGNWAMAQLDLANVFVGQAGLADGPESQRLFGEAVTAYRGVLEVYTQAQDPEDWGLTQNNLGRTLGNQATRSQGEESRRLFGEAVTALHAALQVFRPEQFPQNWALAEYNLGNVLGGQAGATSGAESQRLSGEAVAAYREALKIYTREQFPLNWALVQHDLGLTLIQQFERAGGEKRASEKEVLRLLGEGVAALLEALKVSTLQDSPEKQATQLQALSQACKVLAQGGEEGKKWKAQADALDRQLAAIKAAGKGQ
jgi:tetratricopeptide (TPR) repeat protein